MESGRIEQVHVRLCSFPGKIDAEVDDQRVSDPDDIGGSGQAIDQRNDLRSSLSVPEHGSLRSDTLEL